eukprot:304960-Hanusia_phi.AAC.2
MAAASSPTNVDKDANRRTALSHRDQDSEGEACDKTTRTLDGTSGGPERPLQSRQVIVSVSVP